MKTFARIFFSLLLTAGINTAFAETVDRHITGFRGVNLAGSFDVYITQGTTESVKVDAPDRVMDRIKTEVENGILRVYMKDRSWDMTLFSGSPKIKVYVTIKDISSAEVAGSGTMMFRNEITANTLKLSVTGSGDLTGRINARVLQSTVAGSGTMKLSGRAESSTLNIAGSGDFSAAELITALTAARIVGSGGATVNVNNRLDVSVTGSGDLRYTGAVKNVSESTTGSGSIHRF